MQTEHLTPTQKENLHCLLRSFFNILSSDLSNDRTGEDEYHVLQDALIKYNVIEENETADLHEIAVILKFGFFPTLGPIEASWPIGSLVYSNEHGLGHLVLNAELKTPEHGLGMSFYYRDMLVRYLDGEMRHATKDDNFFLLTTPSLPVQTVETLILEPLPQQFEHLVTKGSLQRILPLFAS